MCYGDGSWIRGPWLTIDAMDLDPGSEYPYVDMDPASYGPGSPYKYNGPGSWISASLRPRLGPVPWCVAVGGVNQALFLGVWQLGV